MYVYKVPRILNGRIVPAYTYPHYGEISVSTIAAHAVIQASKIAIAAGLATTLTRPEAR